MLSRIRMAGRMSDVNRVEGGGHSDSQRFRTVNPQSILLSCPGIDEKRGVPALVLCLFGARFHQLERDRYRRSYRRENRRNLRELLTTLTELNAIAPAAIIGFSMPKAANGIPMTL